MDVISFFRFNFSIKWFGNKDIIVHFNEPNSSETKLSDNYTFLNGHLIFEVIDYEHIKYVNEMKDIDSLDKDIDFQKYTLLDYGEYIDKKMNKQKIIGIRL